MSPRLISLVHFTNSPVRGGAEEHLLTLMQGVDRRCFQLHIVCPPALAKRLEPDLPRHVDLVSLDLSHPAQVGNALRFARILREWRVDILHSHMFCSSLLASPIGRLMRVPIIVETAHGREAWRRSWWKKRCYIDRVLGRMVSHYIAISRSNADYLVKCKGLPQKKVRVIHPGCDLARFDPELTAPSGLRSGLGFADKDPVVVIIARLEAQKGHKVLLDAVPIVKREFANVRVVCAGEGSLRNHLEAYVKEIECEESVRFIGYPRDIRDWLALADLTVLPSFYEGLPQGPIESLAAGRTVVATAVDGTPEVVIDQKTGLTVPPGNPTALAQAICQLLRDPELRAKLARTGREYVLSHFTQARLIQETQEFYFEIFEQYLAHSRASGKGVEAPAAWTR